MIIHWFRRDLRLSDNPALFAAHRYAQGDVIPVFILSDWKKAHSWTGPARQQVLCGSLQALSEELGKQGSRLVLRRGKTVPELEHLLQETQAKALYFNRSPDPAGRDLEKQVEAMARKLGVEVRSFHEVTALEPETVTTQNGQFFRVFTPFSRAWMRMETPAPLPSPGRFRPVSPKLTSLPLPTLADWGLDSGPRVPEAGEPAAQRRIEAFFKKPVFRYAAERDIPAADATSRLSADLRWGTISSRLLVQRCREAAVKAPTAELREGPSKFLRELIWREFYMAILWNWPDVLDQEFQPKFRNLRWPGTQETFQRWCEGTTGFPIVDAGMRQLAATGWMHNRVRMIVAMFLTKDLHLNWRLGERFFMQHLADGEIASNNGGWQWSAGTGADAAPYFRIQNPWAQTARFDPDGEYIRMWVPELRDAPSSALTKAPTDGKRIALDYPLPIVDHAKERDVTLDLYREA